MDRPHIPAAMLAQPVVTSPSALEAIQAVATDVCEFNAELQSHDPLTWPRYARQLRRARKRTGLNESVVTAQGRIGEQPVVIAAFDFRFLGGSMGEVTGTKIVRAFELACETHRPIVTLIASGGARLQEGMRSLQQLQRLGEACARARASGITHICVLRNPSTGGVWVSLAASADVLIAVSSAAVSFAGSRVRGDSGTAQHLAFTAEGKIEHGFVDAVLPADEVPAYLQRAVALLAHGPGESAELELEPELEPAKVQAAPVPASIGNGTLPRTGWDAVARARRPGRAHAEEHLAAYFDECLPLSGDRAGGRDPQMLCGVGRRGSQRIIYVAQTGKANTAAGFRTAARMFLLAERLRLPILTLIDTPGPSNTAEAEENGVGTAIAELFCLLPRLTVPMTSLVIGEGGSGGALALAAPGNLWMTPDSYFAVIAPEGAASILLHEPSRARSLIPHMKLRPQDLVRMHIARGIAPAAPTARHREQTALLRTDLWDIEVVQIALREWMFTTGAHLPERAGEWITHAIRRLPQPPYRRNRHLPHSA